MTRRPKLHPVPPTLRRTRLTRALASLVIAIVSLSHPLGTMEPVPALAAPLSQFGLTAGTGVSVTGSGEASVPAESATVQILLVRGEVFDAMLGEPPEMTELVPGATPESSMVGSDATGGMPAALTAEELAPFVEAVAQAAGVAPDAIEVTLSPLTTDFFSSDSGDARLELKLDQPTGVGVSRLMAAAAAAATANNLMISSGGVLYEVADCGAVEEAAQQAALDDAHKRAERLAKLLGVTLGEVVGASTADYFTPGVEGCLGQSFSYVTSGYGGLSLTVPNFDASQPAEVEVYSSLIVTYEIASH
jgi:hypothetical protein